jgi:uncharacterized SAM-binding protein YcdF (DUF218 family)
MPLTDLPFDLPLALFWLKKITAILIMPPLGPLLLILLGLLRARRVKDGEGKRRGFGMAWLGLALALLLSTPASVNLLLAGLETAPPLVLEDARRAQAIVILGAGQRRHAPEYGGATVNRLSLERLRYGARLARKSGLPILVTGGAPTGEIAEALLMKDALEQDFRVPVRWIEATSLDTRDNAANSAKILRAAGVQRILLVTHAAHMGRAQVEFAAAGLQVMPAPTAWLGGPGGNEEVLDFVPGPTAAYAGWYAVHEWLGRIAYRFSR